MSDERTEELLRRLEALERRLDERAHTPPPPTHAPAPPEGLGVGFDEKRIVDLIVSLTTENVVHELERRLDELRMPDGWIELMADRVVGRLADRLVGRIGEELGLPRRSRDGSDDPRGERPRRGSRRDERGERGRRG